MTDVLRQLAAHDGYWTTMPDQPGLFLSDQGQVASIRSGRLRLLRGGRAGIGYLSISHPKHGRFYIHQRVCEVFRGPRPDGCEVRHLDGNLNNNRYDNLAWGTKRENALDKERHGRGVSGERNPQAKLTARTVQAMRDVRARTGLPYHLIASRFGVSTMTAYRAITRQAWRTA